MFLSYQACKSLKICLLATMERQKNSLFTDLQKFNLQKLTHAVTNFCKSVKCLYISVLSAKNVKMSKMSSEKTFLHAYAHTHAYIHAYTHIHHAREINWHFDILTFLEFILLIFSVLIDLQKLQFLIFIFASPNFCKSKTLSLIGENKLPWRDGKLNTLRLRARKDF